MASPRSRRRSRDPDPPADRTRLVTIETDGSITTLSAHLTPCQAKAVFGMLKALMPGFYIDALTDNPVRVLPLSRKAVAR